MCGSTLGRESTAHVLTLRIGRVVWDGVFAGLRLNCCGGLGKDWSRDGGSADLKAVMSWRVLQEEELGWYVSRL